MAIAQRGTSANYLQRAPSPSGLAEIVDLILDKGLVIDAYVRLSLVGIELLTIDARAGSAPGGAAQEGFGCVIASARPA
jgi:Gas vesicle protein